MICKMTYNPEYRKNQYLKHIEYYKTYYEDNRDNILEKSKEYRKENRDKLIEYSKQYYKNNNFKFKCNICGCEVTKYGLKNHLLSKKCMNYNINN